MVEPEFHTSSETKASVVSHHDTLTHCFYFELCLMRHRFMSWMRLWWSSLQSTPSSKQEPMLQSPEQWCDYSISRLKFCFLKNEEVGLYSPYQLNNSVIIWIYPENALFWGVWLQVETKKKICNESTSNPCSSLLFSLSGPSEATENNLFLLPHGSSLQVTFLLLTPPSRTLPHCFSSSWWVPCGQRNLS